jgi:hypothetical protein
MMSRDGYIDGLCPTRNHFSVPRNDGPFSRSQNVPRNKAGVPGNASPIPRNTKRIPRNLQISCNGGLEFCNLHKKSEEGTSCGPHFSVVLVT